MKPLPPLTEKENKVLVYIENTLLQRGISPSYQEIKEHFGFASYNSVQNYLKQLIQKGYVSIPAHQKRAIQVLRSASHAQDYMENLQRGGSTEKMTQSVPLLGKVAAGKPLEEFIAEEHVDIPLSLIRSTSGTFALEVSGDSMIEDGILNGDIILVHKQATANNGEIVVATIENESTVKRFFLRTHPKRVELRPANAKMSSLWYPPEQVQIRGILVGLIRKF